MRALLVLDAQNHILSQKDFKGEIERIKNLINLFKEKEERVIFTRHIEKGKESPFNKSNDSSKIYEEFNKLYDYLIEKTTPSAFYKSNLDKVLKAEEVEELIVIGFNIEYSYLFTSISAFDRGYNVTFIKDVIGTVDTKEIYKIEEVDVKEVIAYAMKYSNAIKVTNYDDFLKS